MEKLTQYQKSIKELLTRYGQPSRSNEVEVQVIMDEKHNHYQLMHVGWQNKRRVYGCILHIDIKGDKIWIQHDGTEIGAANDLVALGVPKEDIVLGFQSPYKRQFTEFATG